MPDLAAFAYGCLHCQTGALSPVELAMHLEEHFLDGADRWLSAVLPRVVEATSQPEAVPVPV